MTFRTTLSCLMFLLCFVASIIDVGSPRSPHLDSSSRAAVNAAGSVVRAQGEAKPAQRKKAKSDKDPVEDPNAVLDPATHPVPDPRPTSFAEALDRVKVGTDFIVKDDSEAMTEIEEAAISAAIRLCVKKVLSRQLRCGWLSWRDPQKSRPMPDADLSVHGIQARIEHADALLALLRHRVPISDVRMQLALSELHAQVDGVLRRWRKSSRVDDVPLGDVPQLLSLSLTIIHEWSRANIGQNGGTIRKPANPYGTSKTTRTRVEDYLKVLLALTAAGDKDALSGWGRRLAVEENWDCAYLVATARVLQGLRSAQLMGHSVKSHLEFLPHCVRLMIEYQQSTNDGGAVRFLAVGKTGNGAAKDAALIVEATSRGWTDRPNRWDRARVGKVPPRGKDPAIDREDSEVAATAAGLVVLLLGRELHTQSGGDLFKTLERTEFDKAVWDALAYLHRNMFKPRILHSALVDTEGRVNLTAAADVHDALLLSGNSNIGEGPWYRTISASIVRQWFPDQYGTVEAIRRQHLESGKHPADPELVRRICASWQAYGERDPSKLVAFNAHYSLRAETLIGSYALLALHGPDDSKPKPALTGASSTDSKSGAGKSGDGDEPSDRQPSADGEPAEPKAPASAPDSPPPPAPQNKPGETPPAPDGNDQAYGEGGGDIIYGEEGEDYIEGGDDDDELHGGGGDDDVFGDDSSNLASTSVLGHDTIFGGDNSSSGGGTLGDHLYGGGGDDEIWGDLGPSSSTTGTDGDYIEGNAGEDTINGQANDDVVYGGDDDDTIAGGDGADALHGEAGDDLLIGGSGDDFLFGGNDQDELYGDSTVGNGTAGNDYLSGGDGNDELYDGTSFSGASSTTNEFHGGAGMDDMFGGDGVDIMYGGNGDDFIRGGGGNDSLSGEGGDDALNGEDGVDALDGGGGMDYLYDGDSTDNDVIEGGDGDDLLWSFYDGADFINGQNGTSDRFWESGGDTTNYIATEIDGGLSSVGPSGYDDFLAFADRSPGPATDSFWSGTWAGTRSA